MKHLHPLALALLLALASATPIHGESAPPDDSTDPESAPIIVPSKPYTYVDLHKQEDAWYDRNILRPFAARIPEGKPWKSSAPEYMKRALDAWRTEQRFRPAMDDGKDLIQQGCDDPFLSCLVQYFRSHMGDKTGAVEAAKEAFTRIDSEKYYSPAVVRMAGLMASHASQVITNQRDAEIDRRVIELTKAAPADYPGDDDYLYFLHMTERPWAWSLFVDNYEALAQACAAANVPDWVQHTLKGTIEVDRAWNPRGGRKVGGSFDDHYDVARDEFTTAWKEHPTRPDAASGMLSVTMARRGNPGDTLRLWFDRAVAAQFDYYPAYENFMWGVRPMWGGNVPRMLQFARICAETRRFDTDVPAWLFATLEKADEAADWRKVYRSPIVSSLIVPTSLGIAEFPAHRNDWKKLYSLVAVRAYLVGDAAAAASALDNAGGYLAKEGRDLLHIHCGDFHVMKQEIEILQSPAGKSFWKAEQLYQAGNREDAIAAFNECEAALKAQSDPLADMAHARAESIRVEKAVLAGGWVKIPLELQGWRFQGGNCKVAPDGALEFHPGAGDAMAFAYPIVGSEFELRCEVEVDSPNKDEAEVGVLLGEHGTGYYVICGFKQTPGDNMLRAAATDRWDEPPGRIAIAPQKTNTFSIRVSNGQATYQLNGLPVAKNYRANYSPLGREDNRIGLGVRNIHPGTVIRLRNLEVRTDFE